MGVGYSSSLPSPAAQPSHHPHAVIPTTLERSLSHYFHAHVVAHTTDDFNVELWRRSLPQVMHSTAAVWHASNAIAGLSWSQSSTAKLVPSAVARLQGESNRQYSQSIREVMEMTRAPKLSAEAKTTILLTNMLLGIHALYSEDGGAALALHARSCQLIRHWRFWECVKAPTVAELACQVLCYYIRLDDMLDYCLLWPRDRSDSWQEALDWLHQGPLTSTMRAYLEIEALWANAQNIIDGLPFRPTSDDIATAYTALAALYQDFQIWDATYPDLVATMPGSSPIHVAVLDACRLLLHMLFTADLDRCAGLWDETFWDLLEADFMRLLNLVDAAISEQSGANRWVYEVQFTPLLWKSLHFVARKCRAPALRRRAATLLQMSFFPGMDMPTDAPPARAEDPNAGPLRRLIMREESGWCADEEASMDGCVCVRGRFVCNLHRVAGIRTRREGAGPRKVGYVTVGDLLRGREVRYY